ncbi:MAG: hypothetical protein R3D30_11485 [Hyphomicrobiales bacterium]
MHRSTRHKSGVAMRFPRINRIRWDKLTNGLTASRRYSADRRLESWLPSGCHS